MKYHNLENKKIGRQERKKRKTKTILRPQNTH